MLLTKFRTSSLKAIGKTAVAAFIAANMIFTGCGSTSASNASTAGTAPKTTEPAPAKAAESSARGQGIRITVPAPTFSGSTKDDNWVPQVIQDTLTSNFAEYSSMTVIDRANEAVIKAEQKHSEEAFFSDVDAIELGKVTQAQFIVATNIIKTNASYSISFRVLDTSTNEIKASFNDNYTIEQINKGLPTKSATKSILPKLGVKLTASEIASLSATSNSAEEQKVLATVNLAKGMAAENKNHNVVAALSYYAESGNSEAIKRFETLSNYVSTGNIREDVKNDIAARKAWLKTFADLQDYLNKNLISITYDVNPGQQKVDYRTETVSIPFSYEYAINPTTYEIWKKINEGLDATGKRREWTAESGDFNISMPRYYLYFTLRNENGNLIGTTKEKIDTYYKWKDFERSYSSKSDSNKNSNIWFTRTRGNSSRNQDKKETVSFGKIPVDSITDNLQFGIEKITVNEKQQYNREKRDYELVSELNNPPIKVTVIGVPVKTADGNASIKYPSEEPANYKAYKANEKGPAGGRIFWADSKGIKVNGKTYHFMEVCPVIYGRLSSEKNDFTKSSSITPGKSGAIKAMAGKNINHTMGYGWEATNALISLAEREGYGAAISPVRGCSYGGYSDWYIPNDEEQKALSKFFYWDGRFKCNTNDLKKIFTFGGTKSYDGDSWQSASNQYTTVFGAGSFDGHYDYDKYEAFMLVRLF